MTKTVPRGQDGRLITGVKQTWNILLSLQLILIYMGRIAITITITLSPYTKSMFDPSPPLVCLNFFRNEKWMPNSETSEGRRQ